MPIRAAWFAVCLLLASVCFADKGLGYSLAEFKEKTIGAGDFWVEAAVGDDQQGGILYQVKAADLPGVNLTASGTEESIQSIVISLNSRLKPTAEEIVELSQSVGLIAAWGDEWSERQAASCWGTMVAAISSAGHDAGTFSVHKDGQTMKVIQVTVGEHVIYLTSFTAEPAGDALLWSQWRQQAKRLEDLPRSE